MQKTITVNQFDGHDTDKNPESFSQLLMAILGKPGFNYLISVFVDIRTDPTHRPGLGMNGAVMGISVVNVQVIACHSKVTLHRIFNVARETCARGQSIRGVMFAHAANPDGMPMREEELAFFAEKFSAEIMSGNLEGKVLMTEDGSVFYPDHSISARDSNAGGTGYLN